MPTKRKWITVGIVIVILILLAGGFWYMRTHRTAFRGANGAFPINQADTIGSWNFQGAYTGNSALITQAQNDIAHLTGLLGKGQYDDYDLYNGIGNDYALMGDGKDAFTYYNKAIAVHPDKGLAYDNLGALMNSIGAYDTAADAYRKAVEVEPGVLQYHLSRLGFLVQHFAKDTAMIEAALKDASDQFGDTAPVLVIEGQWLESQGRYTDAITAFQAAIKLSPGQNTSNIQAEITRIQAKEAQQASSSK